MKCGIGSDYGYLDRHEFGVWEVNNVMVLSMRHIIGRQEELGRSRVAL